MKNKKRKRKKKYTLHELLEQWTRAEVMARLGTLGGDSWQCFAHDMVELSDKIREKAFGTSDLVELAELFKLPINPRKKRRKKKKRRKHD